MFSWLYRPTLPGRFTSNTAYDSYQAFASSGQMSRSGSKENEELFVVSGELFVVSRPLFVASDTKLLTTDNEQLTTNN